MRPLKLGSFLSAESALQPLIDKAREIDSLATECAAFLGPQAGQARVANFKDGKLVILAPNGASAAKLKMRLESLQQHLVARGAKVNSVQVRVQPEELRPGPQNSIPERALTTSNINDLKDLRSNLADSPLGLALDRLLSRYRR
jgi:hypothetical protein